LQVGAQMLPAQAQDDLGRVGVPGLLKSEDAADAGQALASHLALRTGRLPEMPAAVAPTADFLWSIGVLVGRVGGLLEEHVVDALRVSLDVPRVTVEHLRDEFACFLGRVLEENVVAVGDEHEEVTTAAWLTLAVRPGSRLHFDAG